MTKRDVLEVILAAAEQHGLDDPDDPGRRVRDLEMALGEAVRIMKKEEVMELGRALEREGMLAGWIPPFRRP